MELLTSFEGRINRQRYWVGVVILVIASIIVGAGLGFVIGIILPGALGLFNLLLSLALLYPAAALVTKRLHDRNKPAMPWLAIFFGPGILLQVMQIVGIGFSPVEFQGEVFMMPDGLGGIVSFVAAVVGIWAFVELGFLRGTRGDNDFGPDPLA